MIQAKGWGSFSGGVRGFLILAADDMLFVPQIAILLSLRHCQLGVDKQSSPDDMEETNYLKNRMKSVLLVSATYLLVALVTKEFILDHLF